MNISVKIAILKCFAGAASVTKSVLIIKQHFKYLLAKRFDTISYIYWDIYIRRH